MWLVGYQRIPGLPQRLHRWRTSHGSKNRSSEAANMSTRSARSFGRSSYHPTPQMKASNCFLCHPKDLRSCRIVVSTGASLTRAARSMWASSSATSRSSSSASGCTTWGRRTKGGDRRCDLRRRLRLLGALRGMVQMDMRREIRSDFTVIGRAVNEVTPSSASRSASTDIERFERQPPSALRNRSITDAAVDRASTRAASADCMMSRHDPPAAAARRLSVRATSLRRDLSAASSFRAS